MKIQTTENLRYKLERRINRLRLVRFGAFQQALREFWHFFESEPILCEIKEQLLNQFPDVFDTALKMVRSNIFPESSSVNESVAIAFEVLHQILDENYQARVFLTTVFQKYLPNQPQLPNQLDNDQRCLDLFRDLYLEPFYLFVDEEIDNKRAILSFVRRYKHRSEWFYQDKLRQIVETANQVKEKNAWIEDKLASDLYAYLYDEGINFHISPSSISGRIDLIEEDKRPLLEGQAGSSHRLLADAKVFDGKSRGSSYIGKGYGQILRYCKKYTEPFGYLIIYNISDGEIKFELENTINENPISEQFGKTIFFVVIDINKSNPDSTAGKPKVYTIKNEHLKNEKT